MMRTQITPPFLPNENTISAIHKCWTFNLQRVLIPQLTATIAMWGKEKSSQMFIEEIFWSYISEAYLPPAIGAVTFTQRDFI